MSDQDRGAYTPQTDAPLAFDARRSRGGRGGPALLTLLVSAIILLAPIVGIFVFYRHGMRHAGQAPELVGAPVSQTKSAPSSGAAADDQTAGLQIYKAETVPASEAPPAPSFEPPPEQPAPLPSARSAPSPAVASATLRGPASAPPALPPNAGDLTDHAIAARSAPSPRDRAPAAPVKPAATLAANASPKTVDAAKPEPSAPRAPASISGGAMVQIGAFSSWDLARTGWRDDVSALPGMTAGKTLKIETATKDGKTFYRATVVGFASKADAASFCAALKAKNKPCFVK